MTIAVISMIREPWGGSEELWYQMAKQALAEKHTVLHLSYDCGSQHPKTTELIAAGMKEYQRPTYTPQSNTLLRVLHKAIFFFKKRLNQSVSELFVQQPDIVLYNGTCYSIADENKLLQYVYKSSCTFYILGHFTDERTNPLSASAKAKIIRAYQRAAKVFFVSVRTKEVVEQQLGISLPQAVIVRNPVNLSSVDLVTYPANETIQMAMVANLITEHKGQDIVLQILASSHWKERNCHLNIYGTGKDEAYLKHLVHELGLTDKVSFYGKVNDIRLLWASNHILLMPSHMEGMPLALVEAMLCGRTAVVTDVGGNKEWMDDTINGFIASAATVPAFETALHRAFSRREEWQQMGVLAHQKAMENYDPAAGNTLLQLISS